MPAGTGLGIVAAKQLNGTCGANAGQTKVVSSQGHLVRLGYVHTGTSDLETNEYQYRNPPSSTGDFGGAFAVSNGATNAGAFDTHGTSATAGYDYDLPSRRLSITGYFRGEATYY